MFKILEIGESGLFLACEKAVNQTSVCHLNLAVCVSAFTVLHQSFNPMCFSTPKKPEIHALPPKPMILIVLNPEVYL